MREQLIRTVAKQNRQQVYKQTNKPWEMGLLKIVKIVSEFVMNTKLKSKDLASTYFNLDKYTRYLLKS